MWGFCYIVMLYLHKPTVMIKRFAIIACLAGTAAFAQKANDQYSLEAGYGLGISGKPGITELSHFEVGFRYMVDESWGLKFDFGSDRFRTGDNPELGSDYKRYSVQAIYNLGRNLRADERVGNFGLLAHGGLGYSSLKSLTRGGTDNIGHVIIGLTPQLYLSRSFALTLDTSFILNFTQHYNFDGLNPEREEGSTLKSFTGKMFNASLGLTYYFGKNKSDSDWR
jgi:hypothetical protein